LSRRNIYSEGEGEADDIVRRISALMGEDGEQSDHDDDDDDGEASVDSITAGLFQFPIPESADQVDIDWGDV